METSMIVDFSLFQILRSVVEIVVNIIIVGKRMNSLSSTKNLFSILESMSTKFNSWMIWMEQRAPPTFQRPCEVRK